MTSPRKRPRPSDIIGRLTCDCCGREMPIKLDRNGKGYAYCSNPVFDLGGKKCGRKHELSFYQTQRMCEAFQASKSGAAEVYDAARFAMIITGKARIAAPVPERPEPQPVAKVVPLNAQETPQQKNQKKT